MAEFRHFSANESLMAEIGRPPDRIIGDYVKIGYLTVMFLLGAPINLAAFFQLHDSSSRSFSSSGTRFFFEMNTFKKHLNLADLIILFIFVTSEACWLVSWEWRGGIMLCKLVQFMRMMGFQISSNIIVCISINRLFSVLTCCGHGNVGKSRLRVKVMVTLAWFLAFVICFPQFYVWTAVQPFLTIKWHQCATVWEISRELNQNPNHLMALPKIDHMISQEMYNLLHLLTVFWIPLTIIAICYIVLAIKIYGLHQKHVTGDIKMRGSMRLNQQLQHSPTDPDVGVDEYENMDQDNTERQQKVVLIKEKTKDTYKLKVK